MEVKGKSAYEPSGPSVRSLSWRLWHESTRSISTPSYQVPADKPVLFTFDVNR